MARWGRWQLEEVEPYVARPELMETQAETRSEVGADPDAAVPGVVLVFSRGRAVLRTSRLDRPTMMIGRGDFDGALEEDGRISRRHVSIQRYGDAFRLTEGGSRNGTFVNGARLCEPVVVRTGTVVRLGHSLVILSADVRPFERLDPGRSHERDSAGPVVGPSLARAWEMIRRTAQGGSKSLLILGESGSGKELAASVFHEASGRAGPLVAVNCAAIPSGVAERLLFGARRGAYSGADKDVEGYLQAADRGTLFLDEIAELDLDVQAKLLRAVETREVLPVGATKPIPIDIRLCAATHVDLRLLVARGKFREDLYFRVGRPDVRLPPLRERKDDIAFLVERELGPRQTASVDLVEACLHRVWPGNVRELRTEIRHAATMAAADGRDAVELRDLAELAGVAIGCDVPTTPSPSSTSSESGIARVTKGALSDERILETLTTTRGNVTRAARLLGMHRTQLRRWVESHPDAPRPQRQDVAPAEPEAASSRHEG
jgi:DNA-binding NtrC family response regulator